MRHDWIFDVLTDLWSFAQQNGMPGLAAQVEATLLVAREEIPQIDPGAGGKSVDADRHGGRPKGERPH